MIPSDIKEMLAQLGLPSVAEELERIHSDAVTGQITYVEFLADLLGTEQTERRARYMDTRS
ncbi:hypothetical protein [Sporomusa aerivorans]|uniref:hypothetical protein n=1 Tax=Sporomusa aerivorans TaxID=204936 RepID=UPI00352BAF63